MQINTDFQIPDFKKPLDSTERLSNLPRDRKIKGLILRSLSDSVEKLSGKALFPSEDIGVFSDYPLSKMIEVIPQAAEMAFPGEPPRSAIRSLGNHAFHAIYNSMAGRVIFALGGRRFDGALALVSKIYTMVGGIDARLVDLVEGRGIVALRETWAYPDCYHVGIFEEALTQYGCQGQVKVAVRSLCDVDLEITWTDGA